MTVPAPRSADTPEKCIVYVNSFWEELTGYTLAEVVGSPWAPCKLGMNINLTDSNNLNTAMTEGLTAGMVLTSYKKSGQQFCNHLLVLPVGAVYCGGANLSIVCIMMREIPCVSILPTTLTAPTAPPPPLHTPSNRLFLASSPLPPPSLPRSPFPQPTPPRPIDVS